MTTNKRITAREILTDRGLLKLADGKYTATKNADKYPAVIALSNALHITTSHARTLVNRIIANVQANPLTDPAADRRGGKRNGAGRKRTKSVQEADKR